MTNLISAHSAETMTSLHIAEITGKNHKDVMRDIRVILEQLSKDEGNTGVRNFALSSYINSQNKKQPMFQLTKKGCLLLASGYDVVLRMKIIDRWEELEVQSQQLKVPATFREALLLAAQQQETIEQQQQLLAEQAPKAEFYDQVTDSGDCIDMASVAKVLNMGVGRNKIFEILRTEGVLDNRNQPYQFFINKGYFRCIETSWLTPYGDAKVNIKTVVYQKGVNFIRKNILKYLENN